MGQVCGAVTPYVILGLIMLLLVALIPALATWLPALLIPK
jgi:TRAP-type C4-dicarboxylate transport system permease large subunit